MTTLVLASSSTYRQALLRRLGLPFSTTSPDIDETPLSEETPLDLAERLSVEKAKAIHQTEANQVTIGSDQTAAIDGRQLEKPLTVEKAVEQLTACSGRTVTFFTGLCVLSGESIALSHCIETEVEFKDLQIEQIRNYIDREMPLDCAGSFKCEGLGISLFRRITSDDPTALEGLPLIALSDILCRLGIDPLSSR